MSHLKIKLVLLMLMFTACGKAPVSPQEEENPNSYLAVQKRQAKSCQESGGFYFNFLGPNKCGLVGTFCLTKVETDYYLGTEKMEPGSCKYYLVEDAYNVSLN